MEEELKILKKETVKSSYRRRALPGHWPCPVGIAHPCGTWSCVPTYRKSRSGENLAFWRQVFAYFCFQRASCRGETPPALGTSGLAPSTCSDLEKEVTGTCRQEPLTYIKKVYSRESVYISINISCIYINKYIGEKKKECIILIQHKAVLRESQNMSIAI